MPARRQGRRWRCGRRRWRSGGWRDRGAHTSHEATARSVDMCQSRRTAALRRALPPRVGCEMAHASDERCRRSHASHRCRCGAWIGIVNVVQLGIERGFSPGEASRQLLLFLAIGQLVSRIPLAFIADRRISAHLSAHPRASRRISANTLRRARRRRAQVRPAGNVRGPLPHPRNSGLRLFRRLVRVEPRFPPLLRFRRR